MPVVFLDLDGVLSDFVTGALAVHGKGLRRADVRWDFDEQIGFTADDKHKFWEPMGHDFWAGLGWHTEGRELIAGIESLVDRANIALLTSPCKTPGGVEGKVTWVKNHLPEYSRQLFVGPAKHLMAGPGKILVDDHDANVEKFYRHGGEVVLVPRPWNKLRGETSEHGEFDVPTVIGRLKALLCKT